MAVDLLGLGHNCVEGSGGHHPAGAAASLLRPTGRSPLVGRLGWDVWALARTNAVSIPSMRTTSATTDSWHMPEPPGASTTPRLSPHQVTLVPRESSDRSAPLGRQPIDEYRQQSGGENH